MSPSSNIVHYYQMKIVGHRGARGLAPENTVASLLKAIDSGVNAVEFDVRVTKDGSVILHHDAKLEDTGGKLHDIAASTYEQLKKNKTDLATFEAAAKAVDRRALMLIEVKPVVNLKPVIKAVKDLLKQGWKLEDFCLGSRSYGQLKALHKALPEAELFVIDSWSGVRATSRARRLGAKRLHMNQRWLWAGFIRSINRGGYELYAYTLDNPVKAAYWARHGLAGAITDYPDRYKLYKDTEE